MLVSREYRPYLNHSAGVARLPVRQAAGWANGRLKTGIHDAASAPSRRPGIDRARKRHVSFLPVKIRLYQLGRQAPVGFAARELQRYLEWMTGESVEVARAATYTPGEAGIWLGVASRFPAGVAPRDGADDSIRVVARDGHVLLAGANPRAVLFAAYRWLEMLGCRWFRPGRDGERVPRVPDPLARPADLAETPSARHRVICIEGSCHLRHVLAMIDYAAKRGFNGYLFQFFNCYAFFERWYGLEKNCRPRQTPFTSAQAAALTARAKRAARRRGMALHTVGHRWTCEPFGLPAEQWAPFAGPVPADVLPLLAQVNGERALHRGIPLFTQLCYGNPEVWRRMVDGVVDYAAAHPHEEIVYTALGDGGNNHCECDRCREIRPADLYVRMLNAMDAALTARGLKTRLVFTAYVDLLWGPERERIANPARFLLLFAPITRSYLRSLADEGGEEEAPMPFRRNRLTCPSTPRGNLRLLDSWNRAFGGERLLFEYHYWRMHHNDPGQLRMARIVWQDLRALEELGFSGAVSAQAQRVCFPTGLNMHVYGRTLWDRHADFDALVDGYLADLFGAEGPVVRAYLQALTRLMDHELLDPADNRRPIDPAARRRALEGWAQAPAAIAAFRPAIARGCQSDDPVTAAAWRLLDQHAWFAETLANFCGLVYRHDPRASAAYARLADELDRRLPEIEHVFDTYIARLMCQHALAIEGLPFEERVAPWAAAPAATPPKPAAPKTPR